MNISIHALYERVRLCNNHMIILYYLFQSTHSMKECDFKQFANTYIFAIYFNPRTL